MTGIFEPVTLHALTLPRDVTGVTGVTALSNLSFIYNLFFYIMFYIKKLVTLVTSLGAVGVTGRHGAVTTHHTRHTLSGILSQQVEWLVHLHQTDADVVSSLTITLLFKLFSHLFAKFGRIHQIL